jgi:hypothetical protein
VVEKRVIDWELIEKEYRAGIRSLRDIASQFEITEGTIRSRAKKEDWIRDLSAKIKTKTNDILRKTELRKELRKESEKEIIELVAQSQADVLLNERADIKRLSGLCEKFEGELDTYVDDLDKKARIMKSLTDTRKIIIELRRRNYNINDNSNGDADKNSHEFALDQLR